MNIGNIWSFYYKGGEVMQSFYTILIIGYLLGLGFVTIGKIRLKKIEKEFSNSNCDISEMERIKRLPYMISEMERKRRLPYVIYIIIGHSIPVIVSIILILGLFNII
jgi:hypothetical protein